MGKYQFQGDFKILLSIAYSKYKKTNSNEKKKVESKNKKTLYLLIEGTIQ